MIEPVLLFGEFLTAAAGSDHDANAAQLVTAQQPRVYGSIRQRLLNGGDRERRHARDVGPVLGRDVACLVEAIDLARYLRSQAGCVKAGDRANTAHAIAGCLPERLSPDSVGTDHTHSRDDYSMLHSLDRGDFP